MILLATAFTVGHSLTLFLAGMDLVRASRDWIEFLIRYYVHGNSSNAGISLAVKDSKFNKATYAVTVFFGLIHGLGFSSILELQQIGERE